jgi:hypothetical protein
MDDGGPTDRSAPATSDDPTAIRSVVVTPGDAVAAFEANRQRDAGAVLRITPPFSGRMRARLHRGPPADDVSPPPLRVAPKRLFADGVVAEYPAPDDTADELRDDPAETYDRERHREYHEAALAEWREAARERLVSTATLETPSGPNEVRVVALG